MAVVRTPSRLHPSNRPVSPWPIKRFTVEEYHRLTESGALSEDDRLELLDGWLVEKMPKNPPHDSTVDQLLILLSRLLPAGWFLRIQNAMTTADSEPEPDVAVVRGRPGDFRKRHPTGAEIALVVEVAQTSLTTDREKRVIYARAGVPCYWVVNLKERCLEVFTTIKGSGRSKDYSVQHRLKIKDSVELLIGGQTVTIPVAEILAPPS